MKNTVQAILTTADGCRKEVQLETTFTEPPAMIQRTISIDEDMELDDLLDRPAYRLYGLDAYEVVHTNDEFIWTIAAYTEIL